MYALFIFRPADFSALIYIMLDSFQHLFLLIS